MDLLLSWKMQILQKEKSNKKKNAELITTTRNFILKIIKSLHLSTLFKLKSRDLNNFQPHEPCVQTQRRSDKTISLSTLSREKARLDLTMLRKK